MLASKPPSGVGLNVNRFLAEIRGRKRWSLRVGAAVAPDSNIGAGSDERIIYIDVAGQRLPFRRDQVELTSSGIGISAWAGGEYQYPLGDRYRLRAGGDITRREYRNGAARPLWITGLSPPDSWRSLRQPGYPQLHRARHPQHRVWGYDRKSGVSDFRLSKVCSFRLPLTDDAERAGITSRAPLRRTQASRRADHRSLFRRVMGGVADRAHRRVGGLGAPAAGDGARAQYQLPGAGGGHRGASLGPPWAARAGCAGPITRATGSPSPRPASLAAIWSVPCACSRTTAPSPWPGSARRSPWCRFH